jgi:hypothetical protein
MRPFLVTLTAAVLALSFACKGDKGDQGVQGEPGPQGPAGTALGWGTDGTNVYTTVSGNVGVGTQAPTATLDVKGTLNVDNNLSLAPGQGCRSFTLSAPSGDLADALAPILAKNRCANVTLAASTNWTWNKRIDLQPGQQLTIAGAGYTNGAGNITVNILMTQNATFNFNNTDYREPARLVTNSYSYFGLLGVNLTESSRDTRPITLVCDHEALFDLVGQFATIELSQLHIISTEDVVNVSQRAYGTLMLGHTFVDLNTSSPRNILVTNEYPGFCFGSGIMHVMRSHTTLTTGVTFPAADTHLLYNQ